jgi:DNA-binding response OmpR family regulator
MKISGLAGFHILVVEDDYFIASNIADGILGAGAMVVGPAAAVSDAMRHIEDNHIEAAILNVSLQDGLVFPVADRLHELGVPFIFLTGYDREFLPERFSGPEAIQKPHDNDELITQLAVLLHSKVGGHHRRTVIEPPSYPRV